ncbi:hypothetical protein J120_02270 [candidate division TM6 bacterium JCVI TM6SC1]|uniref:Uncharacterized protein n=1 Tax=candidate division TM6 bacterium JCVI TM6SC1 TaxID=1306947 RepID=A0A0D2JDR8_9BACT|nr:hypothetical protein J120_02270 [candidate division TM6 bacterium JCVI TM6SC1]
MIKFAIVAILLNMSTSIFSSPLLRIDAKELDHITEIAPRGFFQWRPYDNLLEPYEQDSGTPEIYDPLNTADDLISKHPTDDPYSPTREIPVMILGRDS